MTSDLANDSEAILERASRGDEEARRELLELHRDDLRRMIGGRLDRRIASRVDASDVVQEALFEASRHLDQYLEDRPLPFLAWLRQIAAQRLVDARRRHVWAVRRSVLREDRPAEGPGPIGRALADDTSPSDQLARKERIDQIRERLAMLSDSDREVLILRHTEQLRASQIARVLGISESAAKARLLRALLRLRGLMDADPTIRS